MTAYLRQIKVIIDLGSYPLILLPIASLLVTWLAIVLVRMVLRLHMHAALPLIGLISRRIGICVLFLFVLISRR